MVSWSGRALASKRKVSSAAMRYAQGTVCDVLLRARTLAVVRPGLGGRVSAAAICAVRMRPESPSVACALCAGRDDAPTRRGGPRRPAAPAPSRHHTRDGQHALSWRVFSKHPSVFGCISPYLAVSPISCHIGPPYLAPDSLTLVGLGSKVHEERVHEERVHEDPHISMHMLQDSHVTQTRSASQWARGWRL